jgi:MFS transporter, DHA1 family, solute carrier family 18 (vesicular amine transporter), member 1/2
LLAFFVDTLLYAMLPPLLPLYADTLGLSQTSLGVLLASYALTLLLTTIPLGGFTDRIAISAVFACANLGLLAGPGLCGVMVERFGPRSPFYAAAAPSSRPWRVT